MDHEERTLIEILKGFIRHEKPQLPDDIDWDEVVYLAAINSVLGITSYMIYKYLLESDEEVLEACKSCYEREFRQNRNRNRKKDELIRLFQEQGIEHVLFKGAVIRELYPIPEFRSFSDIDILIRKEQRDLSRDFFKNLGYEESKAWEPVFTYKKDQEYYEIHTELLETDLPDKLRCRKYFTDPWSQTIKKEDGSFRFNREFHFIYLLTHLAKHMVGSGAGIRLYMDLAVYVMRYGKAMDWDQIRTDLDEMGLLQFAETAMTMVRYWFEVDSPLAAEEKNSEFMDRFTRTTLLGGTFGRRDKNKGILDLTREKRKTGNANRFAIVVKRLFPPAKQIETRYTYLQDRPWLLPVAWIHRFVITMESFGAHRQELKEIFGSDIEDAEQLYQFLKEVGL